MTTAKERRQQLLGLGVRIDQHFNKKLPEMRVLVGEYEDGVEYVDWLYSGSRTQSVTGKRAETARKILQLEGCQKIPKVIEMKTHYLVDKREVMVYYFDLPDRKYMK